MLKTPETAPKSTRTKSVKISRSVFGRVGLIALGLTCAHAPLIQAQQTPSEPPTGQAPPPPKSPQLPPIIVQPAPPKAAPKAKGPAAKASPAPAPTAPGATPATTGSGLPFAAPSLL